MVISAADGGPEDGRNEGLPIDPGGWQDHLEGEVEAAKDNSAEVGRDLREAIEPHATDFGSGVSAALAGTPEEVFETTLSQSDRLALGDEERLPWLESADDVDLDEPASDSGRMLGFVIFAVLLLAVLVGGLYWLSHRNNAPAAADGSLIAASTEPYKVAPKDPGGKTFAGTGDASFKVSEGEKPAANLAGSAAAPAAKPSATSPAAPAAVGAASAPTAPTSGGGVGVQIGAFSTNAAAEAAWGKLAGAHAPLTGLSHRVVEGKADMATVFRLQAVAGDLAAANALCSKLQAGGLKCQVKR